MRRAFRPSRLLALAALVWLAGEARPALAQGEPPPASILELRNVGLAQLENEKPAEAAETFRRLAQEYQRDPLGPANLAVALLRQQQSGEALLMINLALRLAPDRPDLLAIKADVLDWNGQEEEALRLFRQAADLAPDDPDLQYALYRHATTKVRGDEAEEAADVALGRLRELRPENLVVLLELASRAVAAQDRSGATMALLRIDELLFQAPEVAQRLMTQAREALEANELERARAPVIRLTNLLRSTPMYRSSLVELFNGIQGMPVTRFVNEPVAADLGAGAEIRFELAELDDRPSLGGGLLSADLDGDGKGDLARLVKGPEAAVVELRLSSRPDGGRLETGDVQRIDAFDLDNDGILDLAAFDPGLAVWRGEGEGRFADVTSALGLAEVRASGLAVLDYDSEGDLDLVVVDGASGAVRLFRNVRETQLEEVALGGLLDDVSGAAIESSEAGLPAYSGALATDLDRDGDADVVLYSATRLGWLDNQRQGRFAHRQLEGPALQRLRAVAAGDLDNDGGTELVLAAGTVSIVDAARVEELAGLAAVSSVDLGDLDNDGRLDLVAVEDGRVVVRLARGAGFETLPIESQPGEVEAARATDLDRDGDLDIVTAGSSGLAVLHNEGGNRNHWLRVSLRGLTTGNDKNNALGRGALAEVWVGGVYQSREMGVDAAHFGLGRYSRADTLRIVWNNGVPQHRLHPAADQIVVEEQVLKGSCPFLYTWDGERVRFVTDLLWGAPLGMPVAEGVWAPSDPTELVRVDGAAPRDGVWDLRITEELWEAAYFDRVRLWVVDHPLATEAASNLRIFPGEAPPEVRDERVLVTSSVRPVMRAIDGSGRDVTERVAARDDVYADGYPVGDYQGVTPRPWTFTIDLGEAPAAPIRLLLDGWIFPADASLNLAAAQRRDLELAFTRLEVETASGWQPLVDPVGFPAGKTKTTVIDTPALPPDARRLRLVSSRWLHWDRIAWSVVPRDREARVVARLEPARADLAYRGFSRLVRTAPNAPHTFDYEQATTVSPWLPMAGHYTRYGDVRELLLEADDRLVILAAGDELRLEFDGRGLEPPPPGYRRTVFLESRGWDKDADRNTYRGGTVEPLPFAAMSGYPYSEPYPDSEELERYRNEWLTRVVEASDRRWAGSRNGAVGGRDE